MAIGACSPYSPTRDLEVAHGLFTLRMLADIYSILKLKTRLTEDPISFGIINHFFKISFMSSFLLVKEYKYISNLNNKKPNNQVH